MDEFEKAAKKLIKEYDEDTREYVQKTKYYYSRLCDLFNDYYKKYDATLVLLDKGDDRAPGMKVDMPWSSDNNNYHYRDVHDSFKDFQTAITYLINRGKIFDIIKGGLEK